MQDLRYVATVQFWTLLMGMNLYFAATGGGSWPMLSALAAASCVYTLVSETRKYVGL